MKLDLRAVLGVVLIAALAPAGCAPSPRSVPCSNDGECQNIAERFHYCLEQRCVECVGNASCGEGQICAAGACACADDRGCALGQRCDDRVCRYPR